MATAPAYTAPVELPFTAGPTRRTGPRSFSVPIVVAVTGHRDLVPAELPVIRSRVRDCLFSLRYEYPSRIIVVMTALAEGADRLVAEEALALGMPLSVVLPMPRALYEQDFETEASRRQFDDLCAVAQDLFELPLAPGSSEQSIAEVGAARARQYAQLGVFLCAHCHVLLALWDGKPSDQLGGTSQVVQFHHQDYMPGYTPRAAASRLNLTEDESDLVYHVVCSRDRADGSPADGLKPLDAFWFTTDEDAPRTAQMPARHRRVFAHANEFSREAQAFADPIARECYPLLTPEHSGDLPPGLWDINQVFCAADWLAIHYQKKFLLTLKVGHVCALLIGIGYISYSDLHATPVIIAFIITLMLASVGINALAVRGGWQRKYLDYRTLAEGLRVQFYWAAAGVTSGNVTKFAHDNFLQMQDTELGWIRNVMRVAGTECDAHPHLERAGLDFALREWIGDDASGQLGYYHRKSGQRVREHKTTEKVGRLGVWFTIAGLAALLFVGSAIPESVGTPVVYTLGVLLFVVGLRQSYAKSTAEAELIKQYEFMYRIFRNARRRIDEADSDADRRRLLKVLGDAALEEHAEWILIHRERSIDEKEGLRLN
ncbi:MAG TPA: hypothetical protein VFI92_04840 [Steroidobacteraceae bacterium]|nr:hypothetical protein [Steroidobacteraceae bacterium]